MMAEAMVLVVMVVATVAVETAEATAAAAMAVAMVVVVMVEGWGVAMVAVVRVAVRAGAGPEGRSAGTRQHSSLDTSTEAKPSVLRCSQTHSGRRDTEPQPNLSSGTCPGT